MSSTIEAITEEPAESAVLPNRHRVNSIINGDCLKALTHIKEQAVDLKEDD